MEPRTLSTELLAPGKWPREHLQVSSKGCSRLKLKARPQEIVPALSDLLRTKVAYPAGSVGNHNLDVLLDSGASCSVIHKDYVSLKDVGSLILTKLVNADGSDLAPLGALVMKVRVGDIQTDNLFIVVDRLSVRVILGCDFLTRHGVVIDFDHCTFSCSKNPKVHGKLMLSATNSYMLVIGSDLPQTIPSKTNMSETDPDMLTDYHPLLDSVLQDHRAIFRKSTYCISCRGIYSR